MSAFIISLLITFAAMQGLAARRELQSSSRSGFISIDCGIEEGTKYQDPDYDISYTSDVEFIDTGINRKISDKFQSETQNFEKLLSTVRSFPQGNNSCYTLKLNEAQRKKYLIRAFFMYGNYDSMNQLPVFKLFLDVNEWVTINITSASDTLIEEIIHKPKTDYIHVCLVNIGWGTPFISALELRELNNTIYQTQSDESLALFGRFDRGSTSNYVYVRYADDFYDRIWIRSTSNDWETITAGYVNEQFSDNEYKPPATVMSTAIKPINGTSLSFYPQTNWNQKFHVFMYFLEVENPTKNQARKFMIYLNNASWPEHGTIIVPDSYPKTIHNPYYNDGVDSLNFSINKTDDSTLPPIQNAIEYYTVKNFPQSPTEQSNVYAMINIKKHYGIKKNWQGDPCVPEDFSWEGVECSKNEQGAIKIISLNLSFSGLEEQINSVFAGLDSLQVLDLSNNSLVGIIPDFFAEMRSLTTLNLSGNKLNGSIPYSLVDKSNSGSLALSVDGNPDLSSSGAWKKKKKKKSQSPKAVMIGSVLSAMCLLGLVTIAIFFKYKTKTQDTSVEHEKDKSLMSRKIFTYSEIVRITNNFQTTIGRGGSGVVYLGCLSDESKVAVKRLFQSKRSSKQFQTEVQLLLRIHHGSLTSLVGYCNEGTHMVLIYEHMASGDLQQHLSEKCFKIPSWKDRVQIALDAAQGLEYLHSGCKPPIIHRDLKCANILLDEKLHAKIADFGISRTFESDSDTHVSTEVAGTNGYLDPEYYRTFKLNDKSDVYSFGIVLLELISGLPVFIKESRSIHIVEWVKKKLQKGDIHEIVDPKLRGQFKNNSAWKLLETAMACTSPTAVQRFNMSQVIVELKEALALELSDERGAPVQNEIRRLSEERGDNEMDMAPSPR